MKVQEFSFRWQKQSAEICEHCQNVKLQLLKAKAISPKREKNHKMHLETTAV